MSTTIPDDRWAELTGDWSADDDCQRTSVCTPWTADYDDQGDCVVLYCHCRTYLLADDDGARRSDPGGEVVTCPTCNNRLHCCGEEL